MACKALTGGRTSSITASSITRIFLAQENRLSSEFNCSDKTTLCADRHTGLEKITIELRVHLSANQQASFAVVDRQAHQQRWAFSRLAHALPANQIHARA